MGGKGYGKSIKLIIYKGVDCWMKFYLSSKSSFLIVSELRKEEVKIPRKAKINLHLHMPLSVPLVFIIEKGPT